MSDQFLRSLDDIKEEQEAILEREMDPDMALLSDYLIGELSDEKAAEVRARIQNDPDFRDLAAPLLLAAEHGARPAPMPRAELERKWLELRQRIGLPEIGGHAPQPDAGLINYRKFLTADKRRTKVLTFVIAAAMLVMLIVPPAVLTYMKAASITHSTEWGRTQVMALPDGSRITLATGTAVKTLDARPRWNGPSREYDLVGEAAFEVVNNGTPFYVFTESALVTVVGTKFIVHAYRSEPTVVSVDVGTVLVQPRDADGKPFGEQLKLTPGMRARIVQGFPAERLP